MENTLGQAYLTAGGVQVMTASLINEWSGIVAYTGSGELTVLAGVSILTGIGNVEAFAIGMSIGIGMEYTVGLGAVMHTGASMIVSLPIQVIYSNTHTNTIYPHKCMHTIHTHTHIPYTHIHTFTHIHSYAHTFKPHTFTYIYT